MLFEEFLKPLNISQVEFARQIGVSQPRLNEIIHGKRSVTPDTAMRFKRALGMTATNPSSPTLHVNAQAADQRTNQKGYRLAGSTN
jgi:plasmid maintenance system antidote protein VapI